MDHFPGPHRPISISSDPATVIPVRIEFTHVIVVVVVNGIFVVSVDVSGACDRDLSQS